MWRFNNAYEISNVISIYIFFLFKLSISRIILTKILKKLKFSSLHRTSSILQFADDKFLNGASDGANFHGIEVNGPSEKQ